MILAFGAAVTFYAIFNIAKSGDHIVLASTVYGGTYNLFNSFFSEYGIGVTFVNSDNVDEFEKAKKPKAKAVFIETLGNQNSNLVDIQTIGNISHKHQIPLIEDNTFASPYLLRPIKYGLI